MSVRNLFTSLGNERLAQTHTHGFIDAEEWSALQTELEKSDATFSRGEAALLQSLDASDFSVEAWQAFSVWRSSATQRLSVEHRTSDKGAVHQQVANLVIDFARSGEVPTLSPAQIKTLYHPDYQDIAPAVLNAWVYQHANAGADDAQMAEAITIGRLTLVREICTRQLGSAWPLFAGLGALERSQNIILTNPENGTRTQGEGVKTDGFKLWDVLSAETDLDASFPLSSIYAELNEIKAGIEAAVRDVEAMHAPAVYAYRQAHLALASIPFDLDRAFDEHKDLNLATCHAAFSVWQQVFAQSRSWKSDFLNEPALSYRSKSSRGFSLGKLYADAQLLQSEHPLLAHALLRRIDAVKEPEVTVWRFASEIAQTTGEVSAILECRPEDLSRMQRWVVDLTRLCSQYDLSIDEVVQHFAQVGVVLDAQSLEQVSGSGEGSEYRLVQYGLSMFKERLATWVQPSFDAYLAAASESEVYLGLCAELLLLDKARAAGAMREHHLEPWFRRASKAWTSYKVIQTMVQLVDAAYDNEAWVFGSDKGGHIQRICSTKPVHSTLPYQNQAAAVMRHGQDALAPDPLAGRWQQNHWKYYQAHVERELRDDGGYQHLGILDVHQLKTTLDEFNAFITKKGRKDLNKAQALLLLQSGDGANEAKYKEHYHNLVCNVPLLQWMEGVCLERIWQTKKRLAYATARQKHALMNNVLSANEIEDCKAEIKVCRTILEGWQQRRDAISALAKQSFECAEACLEHLAQDHAKRTTVGFLMRQ